MSDLLPTHQIDGSRVRKEWHDGEWYYSVIDVVAALLDVDHKRAKNYYHVFKNRLNLNNEQVPHIKRLKSKSLDHKS